ncbi:MAG TPA: nucleotidyltransferase family protein, partial [Arenicellales bacterium]|nr:nucleotidyltransferase family protein [Arenicellales bacterium]
MANTTTGTNSGSGPERLLRLCACVEFDDASREQIIETCREQQDWSETIRQAERHGMAPWLHMQLRRAGADVPKEAHRKLGALTRRHADAIRIRTRALLEIGEYLGREGIDMVVLKGAALAYLIYPAPGLRPMSDIDILVAPVHLDRAASIVSDLGYRASSPETVRRDHHHLPTLSKTFDGLLVSVEIHHDALARDNLGSIRLDALSEPQRAFSADDATLYALGHVDMLR